MATPPPAILLAFEDGARNAIETRLVRAGVAFETVEPTWARVQAATEARAAPEGRPKGGGKSSETIGPTPEAIGATATRGSTPAIPRVLVVDLSVRPSHARACVSHLLRRAAWRNCKVVFARAPKEATERAKALADAPGAQFAAGDDDLVRLVKQALD